MTKPSIDVDSLPEFDASLYLDSEEAIAYFLSDAMETQHQGHIADALGGHDRNRQSVWHQSHGVVQGAASRCRPAL